MLRKGLAYLLSTENMTREMDVGVAQRGFGDGTERTVVLA